MLDLSWLTELYLVTRTLSLDISILLSSSDSIPAPCPKDHRVPEWGLSVERYPGQRTIRSLSPWVPGFMECLSKLNLGWKDTRFGAGRDASLCSFQFFFPLGQGAGQGQWPEETSSL